MAKRKHTPQEAMSKLRQAEAAISEGSTVAEASRMIGVSKQTLYRWRAGHRGWRIDQARRPQAAGDRECPVAAGTGAPVGVQPYSEAGGGEQTCEPGPSPPLRRACQSRFRRL